MGDDLDNEWWLTEKEQTEKYADKEQEYDVSNSKGKVKGAGNKKRSYDAVAVVEETSGQVKKKKKPKKKKTEEEEVKESAGQWSDVVASLRDNFKGKIPVIEFEDLILSEENFLPHNEYLNDLSTYLTCTIRKWKKLSASDELKTKSPIVLVITSAAKRAVDLNRQANNFKGKCTSAKLFAKHMKVSEQSKFLSKNKVHFAVGTPNRVSSLIDQDALDITAVKYVILDWNFRDLKKRRMVDIPEIKKDLLNFLKDNVLPTILNGSRLKIGIY
ncbi:protein CMSS1-like [Antedon mediterranea]|uniref:protein CMSS1-like n=1 Tax=Antedon mediterranea TaxID=105859 RepID=UPI003AF61DD6